MKFPAVTTHRWVLIRNAMDYCRAGWMPLPSLDGTGHGQFSVHFIWLCPCQPIEPANQE